MILLQWIGRLVMTSAANFHHLEDGLNVTAVGIVKEVRQMDELMAQGLGRSNPAFLVHCQHTLQKVNEFPSVHLLCQ
jgi:hypothetical protein